MKGSVYKRCPCGTTGGGGKRPPACKKDHGTWYYVADVDQDATGKRRQERKGGFPNRDAAEEALAAVLSAVAAGTYAHDERQTVETFLREWLAAKVSAGLRPTTARSYRQHVDDYLVPHLGRLRLRELRAGHVAAMLRKIAAMEKAPGPATRRRIHATLRSALSTAVRQQLVPFNAASNVDLPAAPKPKARPWEATELGAFLDAIAADRLSAMFELVAITGLRRGEAAGLRWVDIDLDDEHLVVRQQLVEVRGADQPCAVCGRIHKGVMFGPPKTASGESRVVDLDPGTVEALRAHHKRQDAERAEWGEAYVDHGLVFARENGDPLSPDVVTKRFRELAAAAGVRTVRLHDLRHGAASLRLAAGVEMGVVSKVLGHSSISITSDTYSHLLKGVGLDAATKAAALVPRARRDQSVTTSAESAAERDTAEDHGPKKNRRSDRLRPAVDPGAPPGTRTPNPRIKSRPEIMPDGDEA